MEEWVTFTREQLYELVWQKPMSHLAEEYSISDVGLAKLCARFDIPTPPRGYWAKVEAGLAPARPKLSAAKGASPIRLPVARPEEGSPEIRDELSAAIADEKRPENRIAVAERLQSPCELVEETRAALQNAKCDDIGFIERPPACLDLRVSRGALPRVLRIADALCKSFAGRGWEVAPQKDGTFVHVGEIPIALTIQEGTEADERPTKPELGGSYSFHYRRHDTVRKPSGQLSIAIREEHHLWRRTQQRNWNESDKRPMEDRLNDVVVGMLKLAVAVKADLARAEREAQEAAERQRQLEAALEEQRRLRAELAQERACVDDLRKQAARWRESANVRKFVQHAREQGRLPELGLEGQELERWAEWALHQADRLDPFTPSPPSILDDAERIEHMCDGLLGRR